MMIVEPRHGEGERLDGDGDVGRIEDAGKMTPRSLDGVATEGGVIFLLMTKHYSKPSHLVPALEFGSVWLLAFGFTWLRDMLKAPGSRPCLSCRILQAVFQVSFILSPRHSCCSQDWK
jgi:hypothetical protein